MTAMEWFADVCAGVGAVCLFCAAFILALGTGLWLAGLMRKADDNLADIDAPVPYLPVEYPDDHPGWPALKAAIAETPLFDQVLEESDFRAWAEELDA